MTSLGWKPNHRRSGTCSNRGDLVVVGHPPGTTRTTVGTNSRSGDRDSRHVVSVSAMAQSFEYKVVELREGMVGGKMSGDKLEKTLNEHGRQGWQLKAVTAVEIKGRIGPGGVEGVLVTFERPKG